MTDSGGVRGFRHAATITTYHVLMKATKAQQSGLIAMLNRIYGEIRFVEEQWSILADDGDFRPRIEYFHDAVREINAMGGRGSDDKGRLSVELLAYDIGMLRYIQAHPLPKARKLSPSTEVSGALRTATDRTGLKPDASVRYQLADLYKSYGVLFAALFSEAADRNYMSRLDTNHAEVEEMAALLHAVKDRSQDAEIDLEAMAHQDVHTAELAHKLLTAFEGGKLKKRMRAGEAHKKLKAMADSIDKETQSIEQAHMNYATGQLAIYEGAKDVIKKMAFKGFNIVGQFVENAVNEATRGGRGM